MKLVKICSVLLTFLVYLSCAKPGDQNPTTPPPTSPQPPGTDTTKHDSVVKGQTAYLLTSIRANVFRGSDLDFIYDKQNNLIQITEPNTYRSDDDYNYYIFYSNGKVSYVIAEDEISNYKSSCILQYGSNSKCNRVIYKDKIYPVDNSSSYFTNVNDGKSSWYDTLMYNSNNQLVQLIRYQYQDKNEVVNFYYKTTTDSVPYKIETSNYTTGTLTTQDQLQITTNNMDNPACKRLWYFPFLTMLSAINGDNIMLPILIDAPSTYADEYLPFFSKCITGYGVYNSWGLQNYKDSKFEYGYSADSLKFQANTAKPAYPLTATFNFTKLNN